MITPERWAAIRKRIFGKVRMMISFDKDNTKESRAENIKKAKEMATVRHETVERTADPK